MADRDADVIVVGAGAAGLAAAIFTARHAPAACIIALDGARTLGAKILVAGGGRCNVTNERVSAADYCGGSRNTIRRVLSALSVEQTIAFFREIGVSLHVEPNGKLFPDTNRARTVLDALLRECDRLGVEIRTSHRVIDVQRVAVEHGQQPPPAAAFLDERAAGELTRTPQPTANPAHTRFLVTTSEGPLRSRFLVLATGGLSLPKTGSDGGGYSLATALGHSLVPRTPALVPLLLGGGFHAPLSGIAQEVELSVVLDGRRDCLLRGAMLWTHFGVSGPVILDASRHWHAARLAGREVSLRVSFLPGLDFAAAEAWLLDAARQQPRAQIAGVLAQRLPARVAAALAEAANESAHTPADSRQHAETPGARAARADETGPGLAPRADAPFSQTPMAHLTREQRRALLHTLLEWDLPVRGCRGYAYAEVTAGGVPLDEIDPATMASRKCPGLFLVGEILDVDGRIGGFNFQWAWSGGTAAAAGIAPLLIDHNTG